MRVFTIILAALVLLVALEPVTSYIPILQHGNRQACCVDANPTELDTCSATAIPDASIPKNCEGKDCNPFLPCCSASAILLAQSCYSLVNYALSIPNSNFILSQIKGGHYIQSLIDPPRG